MGWLENSSVSRHQVAHNIVMKSLTSRHKGDGIRVTRILVVSRSVIYGTPLLYAEYLPDWIVGSIAQ